MGPFDYIEVEQTDLICLQCLTNRLDLICFLRSKVVIMNGLNGFQVHSEVN